MAGVLKVSLVIYYNIIIVEVYLLQQDFCLFYGTIDDFCWI